MLNKQNNIKNKVAKKALIGHRPFLKLSFFYQMKRKEKEKEGAHIYCE